jgi:hypothetical protein
MPRTIKSFSRWRKRKTKSESRFDPQYVMWRNAVLKRDKFRCMRCNKMDKWHVNVHHIKRWANFPHLRYFVGNGITLCPPCHKQMHTNEEAYERMCHMLIAKATAVIRMGRQIRAEELPDESR